MEASVKIKTRKKKFKKKSFDSIPIKRQRKPTEIWEGFSYEEILAMTPEMLKKIREEKPRQINIYVNHIKRVEWSTCLLGVVTRKSEKFLTIQQLGIRGKQKKTIEIKVTKEISIEISA